MLRLCAFAEQAFLPQLTHSPLEAASAGFFPAPLAGMVCGAKRIQYHLTPGEIRIAKFETNSRQESRMFKNVMPVFGSFEFRCCFVLRTSNFPFPWPLALKMTLSREYLPPTSRVPQ
jgi:hypothetical protein